MPFSGFSRLMTGSGRLRMDDRDFFDHLYQMWTKTSFAQDRYWDYEEVGGNFVVRAVAENGDTTSVAHFLSDADADWVTAIHGCFADLYRRLHTALDEADRADYDRDARECLVAELEMEIAELKNELDVLKHDGKWGK